MATRPWTMLLVLLLGCGGANESEEAPPDLDLVPQATDLEEVPEATVPASYLEAVREAMHSGPEAVLQLYLAWDTAGYRFAGDGHGRALNLMSCFLPEEDCYSPEPGWDMIVVVTGYSWESTFRSPDSAVFAVTYEQVGRLPRSANEDFKPNPPDTVRIARMDGGWFLSRYIRPHVSLSRALDLALSEADSALVREWREAGNF